MTEERAFEDLKDVPPWVGELRTFLLDAGYRERIRYDPEAFGNVYMDYEGEVGVDISKDRSHWAAGVRPAGSSEYALGIDVWLAALDGKIPPRRVWWGKQSRELMTRFDEVVALVKSPGGEGMADEAAERRWEGRKLSRWKRARHQISRRLGRAQTIDDLFRWRWGNRARGTNTEERAFEDLRKVPPWVKALRTFLVERGYRESITYDPETFGNVYMVYDGEVVVEIDKDRNHWSVGIMTPGNEPWGIDLWVAAVDGTVPPTGFVSWKKASKKLMTCFDDVVAIVNSPDGDRLAEEAAMRAIRARIPSWRWNRWRHRLLDSLHRWQNRR